MQIILVKPAKGLSKSVSNVLDLYHNKEIEKTILGKPDVSLNRVNRNPRLRNKDGYISRHKEKKGSRRKVLKEMKTKRKASSSVKIYELYSEQN